MKKRNKILTLILAFALILAMASVTAFAANEKVGDIIKLGPYDWQILDIQDGKALIISSKVLTDTEYHRTDADVTWEKSDVRNYLNGEFLNLFSAAERARMIETKVVNSNHPERNTPGGNDTTDWVFLLSIDEAGKYFADDTARQVKNDMGSFASWWLRSPGHLSNHAVTVYVSGKYYFMDGNVQKIDGGALVTEFHGLRPALWVNIGSTTTTPTPPPAATGDIKVLVNGKAVTFDQPPIIENGRTLVPLRAIFEALGAVVEWIPEVQGIAAAKGDTTVYLEIGSTFLTKNDSEQIELEVPPKIINSRTLVPARAIAEAFGAKVEWDAGTRTVIITE
jgi:hypothetical protein